VILAEKNMHASIWFRSKTNGNDQTFT